MKALLREKFERLGMRLTELDARLADPGVAADLNRYRTLAREQSEAARVMALYRRYTQREAERDEARALVTDSGQDAEFELLVREELSACEAELAQLDAELQAALLPRDPDDERPAFIEIRAGTGGEESALFAADLLRMYLRYAEARGWRGEIMGENASDLGGFKEVVVRLEGDRVYGRMRFESGGHRVQRVPATEAQGRIHTSACTVAVMPEPDVAAEITLNPADLRIDTFRASGAGGQHINKTDSAIRVTHLPTGLVAECQDDRSQHRNKAKAMAVLLARLRDRERLERESREAATRKSLIGSGDRSDRIRTYNFPQGRLTDHRIDFTLYKLDAVMNGALDELLDALDAARVQQQLAALEAGA